MKKPDELNDWIKKQIEDNPQQPPEAAWQQISEDLDLENAWQGISQDMELDNLWTSIDTRLHVYEKMVWWERANASLTTIITLFILFLPLYHELKTEETTLAQQEQPSQEQPVGSSDMESPAKGAEINGDLTDRSSLHGRTESHVAPHRAGNQSAEKPGKTGRAFAGKQQLKKNTSAQGAAGLQSLAYPEERTITKKSKIQQEKWFTAIAKTAESPLLHFPAEGLFAPLSLKEQEISLPRLQATPVVGEKKKADARPDWKVGIGASGRTSWLMNEKTLHAMEKSSLTTPVTSFRKSVSLLAEKGISDRVSLLADVMVYSENGQRYQEYQGGIYGTTDTKLTYSQLNLLAAYSPKKHGLLMKQHTRLLAGISGGWLHTASLKGPLGEKDLGGEYRKMSAAVVLGYEYMIPIAQKVWMGYGVRGHLDLLNIYAGTSEIPAGFRQTRNAFLDFTISFKYDLKKK